MNSRRYFLKSTAIAGATFQLASCSTKNQSKYIDYTKLDEVLKLSVRKNEYLSDSKFIAKHKVQNS